jgi:hypothetical protein
MRLLVVVGVCVLLVASPATATTTAAATGEPPLAEAGLDQTVQRGAGVILDAGGSRDPDGEVTGYDWRIEAPNGTTLTPECSDCERTRFTADAVGEYNVTVEVTDDDGNTANDTLYVTVESPPDGPTVSLSGNTAPSVDAPARYDATATAGDAELETVKWTVDGRNATEQEVDGESATRSLIRAFDDASSRTVRVTVTDEAGRTATDALRVDPRAERNNRGPPEESPDPEPVSTSQATETTTDLCRDNQAPQVSASVGTVRGYAYVNSETNDPDGITDTRYDPRSVISVPEVGKTKTITVTVQDDCGATDSDTVLVERDSETEVVQEERIKEVAAENVIKLHYESARDSARVPIGSEIIAGNPSELPSEVSGEVTTLLEERAVERSDDWTVRSYFRNNDGEVETKEVIITETKRTTTTTVETKTGITPLTNEGKTVRDDLNDDGQIDITDWRQAYPDHVSHDEVVNDLGGQPGQLGPTSQSGTPTRNTNNDDNTNNDNNHIERTNNDRDNDGHSETKRGATKDADNDGTTEVCSKGYCMNVDTDLHNT